MCSYSDWSQLNFLLSQWECSRVVNGYYRWLWLDWIQLPEPKKKGTLLSPKLWIKIIYTLGAKWWMRRDIGRINIQRYLFQSTSNGLVNLVLSGFYLRPNHFLIRELTGRNFLFNYPDTGCTAPVFKAYWFPFQI